MELKITKVWWLSVAQFSYQVSWKSVILSFIMNYERHKLDYQLQIFDHISFNANKD
jgi:hypothetical protein